MNNIDPSDRRRAPRALVNAEGVLSYSIPKQTQPCCVMDISETGAKLQVTSVNHVPDSFRLSVEPANFSAECIVVWRGASEVGVIFQSAPQF